MQDNHLRSIVEAVLLAAGRALDIPQLERVFADEERPTREALRAVLEAIEMDCKGRGFELAQTASGYRFQVRAEIAPWVGRLWEEKPRKYSRALLETLAVIAYRQPVTRGDIEQIRGVAVSSDTIRTLFEREWIRSVGHREVPGRPALFATTRQFLDHFNLRSLDQLPPLADLRELGAGGAEQIETADGADDASGVALSPSAVEGGASATALAETLR